VGNLLRAQSAFQPRTCRGPCRRPF
jgi:hypothetical protein